MPFRQKLHKAFPCMDYLKFENSVAYEFGTHSAGLIL